MQRSAHRSALPSDSARFPRSLRLRKRRQFLRTQNQGAKFHLARFLVFAVGADCADQQTPRLGITVTRKVGHAVMRNRIKRWVREAFRRERTRFSPGMDLVFVAKRQAQRATYADVLRDVQRAATLVTRKCSPPASNSCAPERSS